MKSKIRQSIQKPSSGKVYKHKNKWYLHGYGMKNIMDVVEKYRGIFQSQMVEDHFSHDFSLC